MGYAKQEIELLKKYHPECLCGKHVPVAATDKHNRILEVYCQNCMKPMTKTDHKKYFGNRYLGLIDYDEPGDPKDVDTYVTA